jgi:hypothetical protein
LPSSVCYCSATCPLPDPEACRFFLPLQAQLLLEEQDAKLALR